MQSAADHASFRSAIVISSLGKNWEQGKAKNLVFRPSRGWQFGRTLLIFDAPVATIRKSEPVILLGVLCFYLYSSIVTWYPVPRLKFHCRAAATPMPISWLPRRNWNDHMAHRKLYYAIIVSI